MLNIFVNTWGNYNENGADGGEWITLPMDAEELAETLKKISDAMGDFDPEYAIHDYEWTTDIILRDIGEMENISELNEEIQHLAELDEWQQKTYCAMLDYFGSQHVKPDEVDNYRLYENVMDNYDLGYYWAMESGCYDLEKMGNLANYIDYEAFGRDISLETDGGFTQFGWIERC